MFPAGVAGFALLLLRWLVIATLLVEVDVRQILVGFLGAHWLWHSPSPSASLLRISVALRCLT